MTRWTLVRRGILWALGLAVLIPPSRAAAGLGPNQKARLAAMQSANPSPGTVSKGTAGKGTAAAAAKTSTPVSSASSIEMGRQQFMRFHCYMCHGADLKGGVSNPNAQGGQVPALVHVAEDYTMEETLKLIRNGRSSPLDKADGPTPPIAYMPSWKGIANDPFIHNIADYIWSKQEKKTAGW